MKKQNLFLLLTMTPKHRKIAVMGFRSVGKSCLTLQFMQGNFVETYDATIENTYTKTVKLKGQEYILKVVDTAGQDEHSIIPQSYSLDIHGYILVYSVTSNKSFEVVKILYEKLLDLMGKIHPRRQETAGELQHPVIPPSSTNIPLVLVGNKVDLQTERAISVEEGKRAATQMNANFIETSAKENQSVTDIFHQIIAEIEKVNGNVPEKSGCFLS